MKNQPYTYPKSIRTGRFFGKILIPFLTILVIAVWATRRPEDYQSTIEYFALLITAPLLPLSLFWLFYSWCDIGISDEGMWIEFIGDGRFVPWSDIKSIRFIGSTRIDGVWLLLTNENQLTFFHRTYTLWYARSCQPGFVIHPGIIGERDLIDTIKKNINK